MSPDDLDLAKQMQFFWILLVKFHGEIPALDEVVDVTINDRIFSFGHKKFSEMDRWAITSRRCMIRTDQWSSVQGVYVDENNGWQTSQYHNRLLQNGEIFIIEEPTDLDAFERDFLFVQLADL